MSYLKLFNAHNHNSEPCNVELLVQRHSKFTHDEDVCFQRNCGVALVGVETNDN